MIEHMRRAAERHAEVVLCRHCQADGACACGQSEAASAVELAKGLALPSGSHAARMVAEKVTNAIPAAGPFTRAQMVSLAHAVRDAGFFFKLGRKAEEGGACETVETAANVAAAKMP